MPGVDITAVITEVRRKFPAVEVDEKFTVTVPIGELYALMKELKSNPQFDFNYLTNLTAVDYPDNFIVVYNLVSLQHDYTLMVKAGVSKDNPEVPSLFYLWGAAGWQEREVYDMFGIVFTGHPHMKRILLDEDFVGHPLRKDFKWERSRQE